MRRVLVVITLVVLGAVVTVAVSWGCAVWSPLPAAPTTFAAGPAISGPWSNTFGAPERLTYHDRTAEVGLDIQILSGSSHQYDNRGMLRYWIDGRWQYAVDHPGHDANDYELCWYRAGLPFRSLQGGAWSFKPHLERVDSSTLRTQAGFSLRGDPKPGAPPVGLGEHRLLPLLPHWPGFILNTLLFAMVLGAIVLGPGALRRAKRRRRGLCTACGYPIGTSPVCTECGERLPTARVAQSP